MRYSELRKELANITDAVLAALKELIADDMVARKDYNEIPPHVEYELTEKGTSAIPILQSICRWSGIFCKETDELMLTQCQRCDYK